MGWYKNQKARHEAKKAGLPMPRTGGLADKMMDAVDAKVAASQVRLEQAKQREAEAKAEKARKKQAAAR